jgi:ubiquinone/menaquinone biosynthesis C-methylase UbiE
MSDFDRIASDYEAIHNKNLKFSGETSEFFVKHKVDIVAKLWQKYSLRGDGNFLDFGCGIGRTYRFLSETLPQVQYTGVDPSRESIRVAKSQQPESAKFEVSASENLELPDASYDMVFAACVLHHIAPTERAKVYSEIRRVLKPKGVFVVFEHNPFNPLTQYIVKTCEYDDDAILLTARELKTGLRHAGFSQIDQNYVLFLPAFLRKHFTKLEEHLAWLPAGAQYWIAAHK